MKLHRLWIGFLLLLLLLGSGEVVYGQVPTPSDDDVNAIARDMYCPVCENVPLDVCPTDACAQWRELIRQKLALGWSEDQIKTYFVDEYGDRVLAEPPIRGLNWLMYLLPPFLFLVGAGVLFRIFRNARRVRPQAAVNNAVDDEYLHQLEEELKRRGSV